MRVLLLGGGGREHAIAAALTRSPKLTSLAVAPGNAGTAEWNIGLDIDDHAAVIERCVDDGIDLVVVGPEAPLVVGMADSIRDAGIAVLGPSAAAARLEGSKEFARIFAENHGIPSPRSAAFSDSASAIAALDDFGGVAVVKADGIAAGKGVVVPADRLEAEQAIRDMLDGGSMGSAGTRIVLEELMVGEELSLFAVCDGANTVYLGSAQDHKRVGEGDTGPNTGGMGAFTPVPGIDAATQNELADVFLRRAVDGMAADGSPYVGVLFAGLMMTSEGPKLVEYNCRLGDPEAEVLLPLLESDALELFSAAAAGELAGLDVQMSPDSAACVVVAADGYPASPRKGVAIPEVSVPGGAATTIFHAGTARDHNGTLVSSGGRVLTVTGRGADLRTALDNTYEVVNQMTGQGLFARSDIGWRHDPSRAASAAGIDDTQDAYAASGVSLAAGAATIDRISDAVRSTHNDAVVSGLGSFGGVFDLAAVADIDQPLLVASTDTTGTKPILAEQTGRWEGIGADIVNHGINDVLVQGARPLFMLDTVSAAQLDPEIVGRVVDGMAQACREARCVLLGGETAEVPGVLTDGSVDVAGTMVGAVARDSLLPRAGIAAGHVLVALASSGLHTNGYSLARRALEGHDLDEPVPGGAGETFADALLAVHRSYFGVLGKALDADLIDALAHITGGGLVDNLPRVLPGRCGAEIDTTSWPRHPIFDFLIDWAELDTYDAHQILNCGVGMVCVVEPSKVDAFVATLDEPSWVIGSVVEHDGSGERVRLR